MPVRNAIYCFLGALIWGMAFVAQRVGGETIGPLFFIGARFLMGFLVLLPLVRMRRAARNKCIAAGDKQVVAVDTKATVLGGLCAGSCVFIASLLQQVALMETSVGKAGFLTTIYVVLVPVFSFILTRKANIRVWIAVVMAMAGLYFLCGLGNGESLFDNFTRADILLLVCALFFAMQIMSIDHFTAKTDAIELSAYSFLTAGVLGTIACLLFEPVNVSAFSMGSIISLLYVGIFSSGIAYTFQAQGQKGADPTIATLIMRLESVISAVAGYFILHQKLSAQEILGCVLMFAAVILAQLPSKGEEKGDVAAA